MLNQIILIPIGNIDEETIRHLKKTLEAAFNCDCRLGTHLDVPTAAFNPSRKQFSGPHLLDRLPHLESAQVLGVAHVDLFTPGLNFIFGQADYRTKRAIIALPRLRQSFYGLQEDRQLFLSRAAKEAVHEVGHLYGLAHCPDRSCVMAFSNSLKDTDYKKQEFCFHCLQKIKM
jgi:archaemetzincin